jgi:hypothetical protein
MHPRSIFYATLLPLFGVTLLGVSFGSRRKKALGMLFIGLMLASALFLAGCGGSSSHTGGGTPGTPAGNYTVTVTGTATGASTQTTTFTLTVQ